MNSLWQDPRQEGELQTVAVDLSCLFPLPSVLVMNFAPGFAFASEFFCVISEGSLLGDW